MDRAKPFYIEGSAGKLFAIHHQPENKSCGAILFAPPFAEEMNRSRLMVASQARRFAEAGFDVLLVDYYGTGDSEGEFRDATLAIWKRDFLICLDWLLAKGVEDIYIWGLRFGCLLASLSAQDKQTKISGWIFWEPISDGKDIVNELLRMERVANMLNKDRSNIDQITNANTRNGIKQIAGYQIGLQLLGELKRAKLDISVLENLDWYSIHTQPATDERQDKATNRGHQSTISDLKTIRVTDHRFWLTQEVTVAHQLLELTTSNLEAKVQSSGVESEKKINN